MAPADVAGSRHHGSGRRTTDRPRRRRRTRRPGHGLRSIAGGVASGPVASLGRACPRCRADRDSWSTSRRRGRAGTDRASRTRRRIRRRDGGGRSWARRAVPSGDSAARRLPPRNAPRDATACRRGPPDRFGSIAHRLRRLRAATRHDRPSGRPDTRCHRARPRGGRRRPIPRDHRIRSGRHRCGCPRSATLGPRSSVCSSRGCWRCRDCAPGGGVLRASAIWRSRLRTRRPARTCDVHDGTVRHDHRARRLGDDARGASESNRIDLSWRRTGSGLRAWRSGTQPRTLPVDAGPGLCGCHRHHRRRDHEQRHRRRSRQISGAFVARHRIRSASGRHRVVYR